MLLMNIKWHIILLYLIKFHIEYVQTASLSDELF